jgi:hypothetical protein
MDYQFPLISVSEKEKSKKEYYEKWVKAIVHTNFTSNWSTNYNKLKLLYEFFLEGTGSNLTGYLQTAPDGSAMPGIWTSVSNVKSRLRVLLGELEERGYMIKVSALNTEAIDRKREEQERLRVKRKLKATAQFVEETTGMQLEESEYVPQSDEELQEYMDLTWKDKHVLILEAALKWIAQRTNWDENRKRLFLDVLIANIMIVRNEIVRGVPQSSPVDPMKFIFDPNSTDDMLSDSTYFGEADYVPLATAAERYGLTIEEINEAYKEYQNYLGLGMDLRGGSESDKHFGCMQGQSVRWFKTEDGTPRCLVIKACWRDYKTLAHKEESNHKGDFFQNVTGEHISKKDKDKIVYNKIECWRQGTLIGGKFLREWGECPNQARDLSTLEVSEPPYKVWIPEFFLGKSVGLVEQQVGLALLKDVALYQLQVQMARSIGKVIVLDEAMFPDGVRRENAIAYMKTDGVIFVNSKEYQMGTGNMNLFKEFDLSLSASISQAIQLIEYFDQQLNLISGINQERQGQVQGASTAVGVQQTALIQSNLMTASYFKGFERFCTRVLNQQAKLVKIAWAGKEKFAPIIGSAGVDFLKANIDISLDEFDVVAKSLPPSTVDRQTLIHWLNLAVQSDPNFLADGMAIMLEPDTTVAVRRFQRKFALRQMMLNKQEQQAAEQEQMSMQEQMALQAQMQQGGWNNQLQLQQMKNQGNIQKTLATSRTKLTSEKLRLLGK